MTIRWVTALVALAMLTVSLQAAASHNSFGQHVYISEADEIADGALDPDIEDEAYNITFHENLKDAGLPARQDPADQRGLRYDGDRCQTWGESHDLADYESALQAGDGCYVGFMDLQFEYVYAAQVLLVTEAPSDLLYPANPRQDDAYCQGEEDTGDRGFGDVGVPMTNQTVNGSVPVVVGEDSAADEAITSATRRDESRCGFGQDNIFLPGGLFVDTDIVEAGTILAHETTDNAAGSGVLSLPSTMTPYLYLFGQPHPDTPDEKRSGLEAGEGPFGPNPSQMGSPLADLSGACGDRTRECQLLSPQDILNYDDNFPSGDATSARVCLFFPQYTFGVAADTDDDIQRGAEACGNTGERLDDYVGSTTLGGFGTDTPTWLTNLPGWHIALGFTNGMVDDGPTSFAADYLDDEKEFREGLLAYAAVNPVVPKRQSTLRCVVPNILAASDDTQLPEGFSDPGVYGAYQADAIDTDVHPVLMRNQLETVRDGTHDDVRPTIAAVQENVSRALGATSDAGDALPTNGTVPGELVFVESEDPEPEAEYHGSDYRDQNPTSKNAAPFEDIVPKGLQCDASGNLVFRESDSDRGGGMRFDAEIWRDGGVVLVDVPLKDPTLGSKKETSSDAGRWTPGVYTFTGESHAVLDINNNSQFDACGGTNLEAGEDVCPWQSIWDAYNPACNNNDNKPCEQVLEERGYNVSEGVGLHFVLKQTGPIVLYGVTTEQETLNERTVVGDRAEPAAKTCVIGTSTGFVPKLDGLIGDGDGQLDDAEREQLCGDYTDEIEVVDDAFFDQSATTPGEFESAVSWAKLLPTPATVQQQTGFGADDELCVTGTWTVADTGDGIADDTLGDPDDPGQENIQLDAGVHQFSDCDHFDTTGEPEQ